MYYKSAMQTLRIMILILLAFSQITQAHGLHPEGIGGWPGSPGWPGTDPDHIPKDPFKKDYNRVSACVVRAQNKTFNLHEPAENQQKAIELLALTPTGRQLIAEFNAQNEKTPFAFVQMHTELRRRMGFVTSIGAAYVFDGTSQTIYYDPLDDLGLLALFIAHEMMHAIDPDVPKSYFEEVEAYKNLPQDEYLEIRYRNTFRIERRAFDMQDRVYPELMRLTACYENYLEQHRRESGLKLYNPTPDSYIREAYGLP